MLAVTALVVASIMIGSAIAYSPFELSGDNFTVISYQLDPEVNSIIFEIEAYQPGKIEFTFDREFFDSTNLGKDKEFFGIIDGDLLAFKESRTSVDSRTIQAHMTQGIHEVEIFGSHLMGKTLDDKLQEAQIRQEYLQIQTEKEILSNQIRELSTELSYAKTQNIMLETSNKQLEEKIFDPAKMISETEVQASNLISETEVQASNLISETEIQSEKTKGLFQEQFSEFKIWWDSLFPILR